MAGKTCQICGTNSGIYPLCKKHLEMKANGQVIKNDTTGKWELKNNNETDKIEISKTDDLKNCIVCNGEKGGKYKICKACYYEIQEYKDQLDKNSKQYELNNYYYNLKGNIYRMYDFNRIKNNCNKLIAIAQLSYDLFKSETLLSKVYNDVKEIIEKKQPKEEQKITINITKQDEKQTQLIPTIDGHQVESQGERIIDDILFNNKIVHSYSPYVAEIDLKEESAINADWFIPIVDSRKGVYIEYWGYTSKEYLQNKERKQKQYISNNISLIQIEKEEPFEDIRSLTNRIIRELKEIAKNKYHYILDI